ncbi:MAG: hypothetical protein AB4911_09300 [Oscillochloridaceae bacterium umkhey_bin13]
MAMLDTVDRVFARLLWVTLPPPPPPVVEPLVVTGEADDEVEDVSAAPATRAFSFSLLISALRCTLQYVILPVVLPLIGLTGLFSLPLLILLDLVALSLLVSSLRYFWRTRHPRRFDMLPLSFVILVIILGSLGFDLWQLFA